MPTRHILAIDQGTTNSKALLVDEHGAIVAEAARPLGITYPQPGWVEQDPVEIWSSTLQACADLLAQTGFVPLVALAVTNQRESALVWDRATGQPLGPCVSWQCLRSAPLCADLRQQGLNETVRWRSGLTIGPMFSAGKLRWLLDHVSNGQRRAESGELCAGTVDSWLLWNLTGGAVFACDVTNASRTQLFSLSCGDWDAQLLSIYNIPRQALPKIRMSGAIFGHTVACGAIPAGLPIAALIGDSHAALFGHAGFRPGSVKATYGTGSSLMTPTPQPVMSNLGLSATIAWGRRRLAYALEGNIYATGAAVQWLGQVLGFSGAVDVERLARQADDTAGVYFVPSFIGLGAPHWNDGARGLITGITRGTGASHIARAALDAIAYQVRDVFDAMQSEAGAALTVLLADGGAAQNDLLMQFQADMLDTPVQRSLVSDASALGAAYLAGLTTGVWRNEDDIAALPRPHDLFVPTMPAGKREALYSGWQQAIARTTYAP
jgi:glycerol kinase